MAVREAAQDSVLPLLHLRVLAQLDKVTMVDQKVSVVVDLVVAVQEAREVIQQRVQA
jgi:hypothetical protein